MKRRSFASTAVAGAALATGLAAPAVVRAQPKLRWRLTSS
jgi:TRAP-type mannitol/chloroaromatic compound transport system substrate-binding protein